ncbi:NAD(P)-binding protein [Xylona heveae TC161]|uniref:NAD(P)-binding protein n=1 Tax=Xylona heveae (strain CBS 132557 / TC161) TaxID=1328760 RepID=A0A161TBJ4_XYLHT|nr:NAD(P)-binding protein [Xylona heveae TC161]KZF23047.1 NAD(P)-binding protein [Xylona heveae TC161]
MSDQQKYTNKLSGARVLVVGGSSGIGFSVAEAALEHGAIVTISSSQESRVQASVEKLKKSYPSLAGHISGYACDLATEEGIENRIKALFDHASSSGGHLLDHIVFTAGDRLAEMPLEQISLEKLKAAGMVRFFGPLLFAKIGKNYMSAGPKSSFVFTTGSVSQKPIPGWSAVAGYASAMHALVRNLALDLKPIRVNLVSPGAIDTELWKHWPEDRLNQFKEAVKSQHTTGQMGKPEDVAEAYLYLMRDQNCSGTMISSNGGSLLT